MSSTKYDRSFIKAQFDPEEAKSSRKVKFVIAAEATGKEHRNKFIYNWDNWDLSKFQSNPIVMYQHNAYGDNPFLAPNPDDIVGKASVSFDTFNGKRALVADVEFEPEGFNPTADKLLNKIIFGSINATSVGILPKGDISRIDEKNQKGEIIDHYWSMQGQELIELSIVNIPADANALRRSMKSQTLSALHGFQRFMPELSMVDIKNLKVSELLDAIEGKYKASIEEQTIKEELSGPQPNIDAYINKLNKYKK